jgi:hypothetical protein
VSTDLGERFTIAATSALEWPSTTSCSTWRSRGLRLSRGARAISAHCEIFADILATGNNSAYRGDDLVACRALQ